MARRLICPRGHQWDAVGPALGQSCPACRAAPIAQPATSRAAESSQAVDAAARAISMPSPTIPVKTVPWIGPPDRPIVPGYEILGELGRGGMGVVYRARETTLKRLVALKMILAGSHAGPRELARFRSEAEAVARLQHSNIVQIYQTGEHEGRPFFSLELVEGGSLAQQLTRAPLSIPQAARLTEILARAVHSAHQRHIVHRDLKPANILLAPAAAGGGSVATSKTWETDRLALPWVPKITDFGLAKHMDDPASQTRTGAVLGTPSYMAPEQALGRKEITGPAIDIHALGAMLYEMLAGRPPFRSETPLETMLQVASQEPVPPSRHNAQVPRDLETICLKCLQKNPRQRYATAESLADDLRRFLADEPIIARPIGPGGRAVRWIKRRPAVAGLAAAMVLVTVLGATGMLWKASEAARERRQKESDVRQAKQAEVERYFGHIASAQRDYLAGNLIAADKLLDECPAEYRHWEWHYLKRRCNWGLVRTLNAGTKAVRSVAYSPDGSRLASAGFDGTVKVWDPATGRLLLTFREHIIPDRQLNAVYSVAFSPDRQHAASAGEDGTVKVWNAATGAVVHTLGKHDGVYRQIAFSPDGERLAAAGHALKIWNVRTGILLSPLVNATSEPLAHVAFNADGKYLASARRSEVRSWQATTGKPMAAHDLVNGLIRGLAFSGKDAVLGVSTNGGLGKVYVYDESLTNLRVEYDTRTRAMDTLAVNPNGNLLACAISSSSQMIIEVREMGPILQNRREKPVRVIQGHGNQISQLAFSPDGQRLASASADGSVKIWDLQVYPVDDLAANSKGVSPARGNSRRALSADGRRLATLEADQVTIVLRDAATEKPIITLQSGLGPLATIEFSADGHRLVGTAVDRKVQVWDATPAGA